MLLEETEADDRKGLCMEELALEGANVDDLPDEELEEDKNLCISDGLPSPPWI